MKLGKALMNISLVLVMFFSSETLYSQDTVYFDSNWEITNKHDSEFYRIIKKKNNAYHIKDHYKSGKIQFEGISLVKDEPLSLEGLAIWYYENGNISEKGYFKNNLPNDSLISYYSEGQIKSIAIHKSGLLIGKYIEYFPDGSIAFSSNYNDGKLNGMLIKYKKPDQIDYKAEFRDDEMHGIYEFYNSKNVLENKGNTFNGVKNGLCQDYYYGGELRHVYTVHDNKLEGNYIEYTKEGDTLSYGLFKEGKPQIFKRKYLGKINDSFFRKEMQLVDGVEEWKTFRDDKLIIESFYKNGVYFGKWKIYNFDGTKLYEILDFTKNETCMDHYIQIYKTEFNPNLIFSERFNFLNILENEKKCENVAIISNGLSHSEHPIHHLHRKNIAISELFKVETDKNIVKNYIDPSSTAEFVMKNDCVIHEIHKNVTVCSKIVNKISYVVFIAQDKNVLDLLKKNAKPNDNQLFFYYQQFENRDYDFNKEIKQDRYLTFSIPISIKQAIKENILDKVSLVGVLEHKFWNVDNFSGTSAMIAFDKEMDR